jgi:hypothetical protein
VRELLGLAVRHRLEYPPDDAVDPDADPDPFAVDAVFWATALPPWFLERTPFASAALSSSEWTVEGWLYWFLSADEERSWRWVSAAIISPTRIDITIQVADLPLAWEALRWTLHSAGATSATL